MSKKIGMMDPAYFVPKTEIIKWVNEFLEMHINKIEDTCSGAIACQIMDALYPGSIPMSRVDFGGNQDYQYVNNYKLLQRAFDKNGIDRYIEVEKLIRGKYQDNLEFMQWLKAFFDQTAHSDMEYDAVSRRAKSKGIDKFIGTAGSAPSSGAGPRKTAAAKAKAALAAAENGMSSVKKPTATKPARQPIQTKQQQQQPTKHITPEKMPNSPQQRNKQPSLPVDDNSEVIEQLRQQIASLEQEVDEKQSAMEGFEEERDFYYGKLRDIEVLLQNENITEDDPSVCGRILKVLYATDDDEGVDQENVIPTNEEEDMGDYKDSEMPEYEEEGVIDDDDETH